MRTIAILLGLLALFVLTIDAQNVTHDSYRNARAVIDRAVTAYGGIERLRGLDNFTLKASGDRIQRNQSRRTFGADRIAYQLDLVADRKNERVAWVQKGGYPGGFVYNNGQIVDKNKGTSFDLAGKRSTEMQNVSPALLRFWLRFLPQYWVMNAAERAAQLRNVGKAEFEKRPHTAVSYANEDGGQFTLYFDDKTHLLSGVERLGTDPFAGDAVYATIFPSHAAKGDVQLPTGRIQKINNDVTEELRYDELNINGSLPDDRFKLPDGLRATTFPAPTPVNKYSDNVYTVTAGGYNVLVVGFSDHVFVMEAPGRDSVSRQAIAEIRKIFPGKPIRYIAVTHHHDDHAGGIRTYFSEGATLLALPGERSFFEDVAKARFTIEPDLFTTKPQPVKIEAISDGRRVLTDGTTTVELIDIGSGPHAEEMLVAYLPNEKLVFQGDLLNRPANNDPATINDTTVHFAGWLESKKLAVDRVIGVHGPPSTMDELRKGVAERR
jgi:glyoxylase-like metal-dependent hydrolase (beta-lactamase superfamily II)